MLRHGAQPVVKLPGKLVATLIRRRTRRLFEKDKQMSGLCRFKALGFASRVKFCRRRRRHLPVGTLLHQVTGILPP